MLTFPCTMAVIDRPLAFVVATYTHVCAKNIQKRTYNAFLFYFICHAASAKGLNAVKRSTDSTFSTSKHRSRVFFNFSQVFDSNWCTHTQSHHKNNTSSKLLVMECFYHRMHYWYSDWMHSLELNLVTLALTKTEHQSLHNIYGWTFHLFFFRSRLAVFFS